MSKNEARRQKQLAKKKSKRDDKRTQIARQTSDNPLIRLASAESWPIVASLVPGRLRGRSPIHPATRVFQALRIAVNDELGTLGRTLPEAFREIPELASPRETSLHPLEILRCLRLKVWDVESQRMVGFDDAMRQPAPN